MGKKRKTEVDKEFWPTKDDVKLFSTINPLINSDLREIRELSKKKQDEPLNKFKINIINKKLEKAIFLLRNEPATEFLELLDEASLPTNSDAVLQISQFIIALKKFHHKYYSTNGSELGLEDGSSYEWKTKD
ncbi:MAG: hypothetical protein LBG93_05005 [Treponema sp.]|jgi:hypothetical protein|nr:hypothetical protein [Treponema sp.]